MKLIFIFLFIIIAMPLMSAIDCNTLLNKDLCLEINNADITNAEKDYLLADIINDLKNFPSHDFVREWNFKIDSSSRPDNINEYSQGYIKNAWVKLLTVMPSVLENNTLYTSDKGEILSAFNYTVKIPSETIAGDCKTEYSLKEDKGVLNAFINNIYIGSGKLVNFTNQEDSNFKVEYSISVKTDISHYKWKTYCCSKGRYGCRRTCRTCEYSYTEHKEDTLKLNDKLDARYYNPEITANFSVEDKYAETTKGILSGNNFTSMHLFFSDSYFEEYNYLYSIVWNTNLYNILTVKADKKNRVEHSNLFYEGNKTYHIIIRDTTNCKIQIYDYFKNKTLPCNLYFNDLNIKVDTDKLVYDNNESIKITIIPSDKAFNITYANKTIIAKNSFDIKAVYPYNKISILYNGRDYDSIIYVKNKESLTLLFSLLIFLGVNYLIIGLLRKYWGLHYV